MIKIEITGAHPTEIGNQLAAIAAMLSGSAAVPSEAQDPVEATQDANAGTGTTIRLRGKPGEGRQRRSKEEMAEDEALEQAAVAAGVAIEKIDEKLASGLSREEVLALLQATSEGPSPDVDGDFPQTERIESTNNEPGAQANENSPADRDEVRQAIVSAAAKRPQSERGGFVQSILNPFGVKKLGDLPDDKLGEVLVAVKNSELEPA